VIQQRDPDHIAGKDFLGDRWDARVAPPIPQLGIPALITIRTLEGSIQLEGADARALAEWLTSAVTREA
jgi:hypothetical protein